MLTTFGLIGASGAALIPGSYDLVTSTVLSSAQSSVTFDVSSLAGSYKHLQIKMLAAKSGQNGEIKISFNGTGLNYVHYLYGNGSTVGAGNASGNGLIGIGLYSPPFTANHYAPNIFDITDAFSTSKYKTVKSFFGYVDSVESSIAIRSGLWENTNAITSITITSTAVNFISGSRFSLYGIKG
jgi:hypothetical protein